MTTTECYHQYSSRAQDGPCLCHAPGNEGKVCLLEAGDECEAFEDAVD